MSIFTGAGVALITPMHEDGSINYDEMERIVNYQIENGTDAIIVCGTTGEASTMTHEEHIETIKACVEMTKKRIPVIQHAHLVRRHQLAPRQLPVGGVAAVAAFGLPI